jgi:hypothetical protein
MIIYLARSFVSYSYEVSMPKILCGYLAYVCVFCGIVLAKYIGCPDGFFCRMVELAYAERASGSKVDTLTEQIACNKDYKSIVKSKNQVDGSHILLTREDTNQHRQSIAKQRRRNSTSGTSGYQKRRMSLPIIPANVDKVLVKNELLSKLIKPVE